MDEPIPVSLAIRAVERSIRECDAATPGPWDAWLPVVVTAETGRFITAARAGFRAALEYLRDDLTAMEGEMALPHHRRAVAPLIDHYDRVAPGWRTE